MYLYSWHCAIGLRAYLVHLFPGKSRLRPASGTLLTSPGQGVCPILTLHACKWLRADSESAFLSYYCDEDTTRVAGM